MKKSIVSMMIAVAALLMAVGCSVPQGKLTDYVEKTIVKAEKDAGNSLEVTEFNLGEKVGKDYKGVMKGLLNGKEVVYDVSVVDEGGSYDVDWELRN